MNAPELSVTLKFRGVTVEGMTVAELRELRDLLDQIVGEKARVVERHEYVPYQPWWEWRPYIGHPLIGQYWTVTTSSTDTVSSSTLTLSCNK